MTKRNPTDNTIPNGATRMQVDLTKLKPNSLRDFRVDPIDPVAVQNLRASIHEDGFWGGIVVRRHPDGTLETVAGEHRRQAAIAEGITTADIFVARDLDDAGVIRIYARENATQRGNTATATAGTVAAAMRFLAKAILTAKPGEEGYEKIFRSSDLPELRGNLASDRGIGRDLITRFLEGVPSINDGVVQGQLANLKSAGIYARIMSEVEAEIAEENAAELAKLKAAEEAEARARAEAEAKEKRRAEAEAERKAAEEKRKAAAEEERKAKAEAKAARDAQAKADAQARERKWAEEARKNQEEADRKKAEEAARKKEADKAKAEEKAAAKTTAKFEPLRQTRDATHQASRKANEGFKLKEGRGESFDFEGVAKHFRTPSHINAFRTEVTSPTIRQYLPTNKQAALARQLVALAKERGVDVDVPFIRFNVSEMLFRVKTVERRLDQDDRTAIERGDWERKARRLRDEFTQTVRKLARLAGEIRMHESIRPKRLVNEPIYSDPEFQAELRTFVETAQEMKGRLAL